MSSNEADDALLGKEYEHTPVPPGARRTTFSVSMVWLGAPMIITTAITGSILVASMGFLNALWAILAGNLMMFAYTGALAHNACRTGRSSALQASAVFGRTGYIFVSGLLSTLVLGWFAVQTGLGGTLVQSAFQTDYLTITLAAGAFFIGVTVLGIKGLHFIGLVSVPSFLILGGWVVFDSASAAGWDKVVSYAGATPDTPMAFGVGVTMVFALFADGGTLTGDYSRWAPSAKGAWISTFSAFPFGMTIAMLVGGVMTAALQVPNPNAFGADNMFGYMVAQRSTALSVLAVAFLLCNLGSICSHCLYFSAVGYSKMTKSSMRVCCVILGVVGTAIAAANVWAMFIPWLTLLGIIVPPIGAILIMDAFVIRPDAVIESKWRGTPFIAWAVGSVIALLSDHYAPALSSAFVAFLAAAVCYWTISGRTEEKGVGLEAS